MCTVSMIYDFGKTTLPNYAPNVVVWPDDSQRIAELERKVTELEQLLRLAKKYDKDNDQPDCEMESKKAMLAKIAEHIGVTIDFPA